MTDTSKERNSVPKNDSLLRNWQGITLDDIEKQWAESKDVHPAFGRKLCQFAAGIEDILKQRNHVQ
jgi:hypothetical protein